MSREEMVDLYSTNDDVKQYINKFAANRHKLVEDCFMDSVVQAVTKEYIEKGENHGKEASGVRELVPEVQVCDKR